VPQPTTLPRAPLCLNVFKKLHVLFLIYFMIKHVLLHPYLVHGSRHSDGLRAGRTGFESLQG
jgi:hypothetical protein